MHQHANCLFEVDLWRVTAFQALLQRSFLLSLIDSDACGGPGQRTGITSSERWNEKSSTGGNPPQPLRDGSDFRSSTIV